MTNRHPHRRKILGAISAGILAMIGGCYLISNDGDEDVGGDREENETTENETGGDGTPQDPNETELTTDPDIYDPDADDC